MNKMRMCSLKYSAYFRVFCQLECNSFSYDIRIYSYLLEKNLWIHLINLIRKIVLSFSLSSKKISCFSLHFNI